MTAPTTITSKTIATKPSKDGRQPADTPYNEDAERAIVGAVLYDPEMALSTVRAILKPDDFFIDRYRWVFEACLVVHGQRKTIDFVTVTAELEKAGRLAEIGGPAFVASLDRLIDYKRDVIGVEDHARWVHVCSVRRAMLHRAETMATRALNDHIDVLPSVAEFTDMGNSRRLAIKHGDRLRFTQAHGWLVWDGQRWKRDDTGEVMRLARQTARSIFQEAEYAANDDTAQRVGKWAVSSQSRTRLEAMIALGQSEPEIAATADSFDSDPMLLNVVNGMIDLRTGALLPHDPARMITRITPIEYDPGAQCPTWVTFLDRIMGGDAEMIAFLQRAFGYSLSGDTSEQCLFFCYGTGANGKSTCLETVRAAWSDYGAQAESTTFLAKHAGAIRNDIARLAGARFVAAIEAGEGRRLAEVLVKTLTGGDTITARHLYREFFEFRPTFKVWLAANHKPIIRGTDWAIWRRIRMIPFTVTIPEAERDPRLAERLRAELPGILAWAVQGCLEWQRDGLQPPAEVRAATEAYRVEMDVIAAFLDERCVIAPNAEAKASDLYASYKTWAESNSEYVENQRTFGLRLSERGFERKRTSGGFSAWRGIGLLASE